MFPFFISQNKPKVMIDPNNQNSTQQSEGKKKLRVKTFSGVESAHADTCRT